MFSFFEKQVDPYPVEEPTTPPKTLLAFCWHYSKSAMPWLLLMSLLGGFLAAGEVILFYFLGDLVDWLAEADRDTFLQTEGWYLFAIAVFILLVRPLSVFFHALIIHQTLLGAYPMIARWQMHRYLLKQSMNFYANEFAGRVATKVMQTSLAVREAVMKMLDVFVYITIYFTAMLILAASADWRLMIPLVIWLFFYIAIMIYLVPRLRKTSEAQADARSLMTGRVVDSYTNIATVKLFSHAGREATYAREGMDIFLQTVHRQMRLVTILQSLMFFNNSMVIAGVAGVGIWLWLGNIVSIGAIAAAMAVALRLNGMSQWIMWEFSSLFEQIGVIHDGMTMMAKPHEVKDITGAEQLIVPSGRIDFSNVTFNYGKVENTAGRGVLNNLDLSILPGEKIGLVGRSGAGKTTLTNILLRFYDLEGGDVLIDGMNISHVTQDSLRAHIGVVTQDTSLLHRSIRDNIAYGHPDATEDEIVKAAKRAKAYDFILDLEDQQGRKGLDAQVGERGVKLSGGQRQRIAIARVFLKDAPILVLDEATSALDSEVEAAIQDNLFDLMEGKTVIAIAHRLSTISALDRLVVMNEGEIVEMGTHHELKDAGGIYGDLWARQSGGFIAMPEDEEDDTIARS